MRLLTEQLEWHYRVPASPTCSHRSSEFPQIFVLRAGGSALLPRRGCRMGVCASGPVAAPPPQQPPASPHGKGAPAKRRPSAAELRAAAVVSPAAIKELATVTHCAQRDARSRDAAAPRRPHASHARSQPERGGGVARAVQAAEQQPDKGRPDSQGARAWAARPATRLTRGAQEEFVLALFKSQRESLFANRARRATVRARAPLTH